MRELKYRAYIKPLKRYATGIDTIQFHKCCDVEGAGIWTVVTARDGIFEFDDIIVEQYTGLKDKNGKEIYEGDIVKLVGDVADNKCRLYQVYYRKSKARYWLMPLEVFKSSIGVFEEVEMSERYEVISTIHEYPKLLQEEE